MTNATISLLPLCSRVTASHRGNWRDTITRIFRCQCGRHRTYTPHKTHTTVSCEIDLSILRLAISSKHGRSRLSRKRTRRPLQFLHSWVGTIAPRPVVHGDSAVLSGGDSLVRPARMDHPSLVDSRCGSVQAATVIESSISNRAVGVRRIPTAGRCVSRMEFYSWIDGVSR